MNQGRTFKVVVSALALTGGAAAGQQTDPFVWLEEVEGPRALEWVESRNASTVAELAAHPLYQPLFERTVGILDSHDRIAYPSILGDRLYNFWQDAAQPRGVWRRTGWDSYLGGEPVWETVLDIDELAAAEGIPWAFAGATCLPPEYRLCLVRLSRGGADAVEVREFDTVARRFIEDGFRLPEAKQSVAWVDRDALLVAGDFGEGSMTTSGYARSARLWRRGTSIDDATTLFEAPLDDMGVWVGSVLTASRRYHTVSHRPNFYEGTTWILREDGSLVALDVPLDASTYMLRDRLLVYVRSPWQVGSRTFAAGSLLDIAMDEFLAGSRELELVLQPDERQTIGGVGATRDYLLVSMLDNVRGELRRYRRDNGRWTHETVPAPEFGSIGINSTSPLTNRYFFSYSGFTQPPTLYVAQDEAVREVRRMPAMFDATGLVVEQHEARSRDGTRVPYFTVQRAGLARDGRNPTLLYAYGGFEVSMQPSYNSVIGASWLERGGVYVVANIRGGGEFGPAWHRAALKENRQRAYDDFIAVSEDLIARGITSPARLGIMGGSNGGLLMGVAMTQRPELYNAIVIQVPLLDMQRYHQLLAGASWMAEYGNPDVPEEWEYIRLYSPYHNVKADAEYPKVLFTTTTRDDRVHPGHARKMAALMESLGHPFYYFENTEGGHGSGVTSEQRAKMSALTYTYLWQRLAGPAAL